MRNEKDSEEDRCDGMSAKRAYVWYKRLFAMLLLVITTFFALMALGLPYWWVAPAFSFACAEVTRRICNESNPHFTLTWKKLLRLIFTGKMPEGISRAEREEG